MPVKKDSFCEDVWTAENGQPRYITEENGPMLV